MADVPRAPAAQRATSCGAWAHDAVVVTTTKLTTTGGTVWGAAHRGIEYLEAMAPALGLTQPGCKVRHTAMPSAEQRGSGSVCVLMKRARRALRLACHTAVERRGLAMHAVNPQSTLSRHEEQQARSQVAPANQRPHQAAAPRQLPQRSRRAGSHRGRAHASCSRRPRPARRPAPPPPPKTAAAAAAAAR